MATFNVSSLPNPINPQSFLPPVFAFESQVSSHICVGTMGVFVWDILVHLDEDWKILTKHKPTLGTVVYFVSRIFTFLFVLAATTLRTATHPNCVIAETLSMVAFCMAIITTSLLFFLRAAAIFDRNWILRGILFTSWLAVVGAAMTLPIGIRGAEIGPTGYCETGSAKTWISSSLITPLLNDSLVFIVISFRLLGHSYVGDNEDTTGMNLAARAGRFIRGEYIPAFSRAVLQDGQRYYFISVISSLVTIIIFFDKRIPVFYETVFAIPDTVLTNMMAALVFRNTKLGFHRRVVTTSQLMTHAAATGVSGSRTAGNDSIVFNTKPKGTSTGGTSNSAPTARAVQLKTISDVESV